MTLNLLDSDFQKGVSKWHHEQSAGFMMAVDELQKQYNDGTLEVVSLQSYNLRYQHQRAKIPGLTFLLRHWHAHLCFLPPKQQQSNDAHFVPPLQPANI